MSTQEKNIPEQTLSQQIISQANKPVIVEDDLGRVIVIRKPKYSHYLNLLKALGPELSKNSAYVEAVGICSAIISIDGDPMPLKSLVDIEVLISKLENSENALTKIGDAIKENFSDHKTPEDLNEAVKK